MTESPAPIGGWRTAVVKEVDHPTPHAVRLRLEVPDRVTHLPGQHYIVRLTAPDGYTASRSYSIASAPADPLLELFVERLEDGEVSGFLADVVEAGDQLEVRGPIGGYFVWTGRRPALGIGGGTGVVPLLSMLRHAELIGAVDALQLAVVARTLDELPYPDEFAAAGARIVLSRQEYRGRSAARLGGADLPPIQPGRRCFVCGSAGFAESASQLLVTLGAAAPDIRVERFGPSG